MNGEVPRELICILCPTGCRLRARATPVGVETKGAACDRGREYAATELVEPLRTFTGTVRVTGGDRTVLSVKSDRPIPREDLLKTARVARRIAVRAPVSAGEVVGADLAGGARFVATSNVRAT